MKIVLIGAASRAFGTRLTRDILSWPELRNSTISLMDINKEHLEAIAAYVKNLVAQHRFETKIESTTNRREALDGADYVLVAIRVGPYELSMSDKAIPEKYGVDQAVGDTIGPGGVFYGLRHIPVFWDICHDMEELCPGALLMNYTNPMGIICWAINDYSRIENVGLCHSVQLTSRDLARYIGVPYNETYHWVAGINHHAWFLQFKWRCRDAYPLLREKFKDSSIYLSPDAPWARDLVRVEIFKQFGYYVSESSSHMSEYVPYFRKHPELYEEFRLRRRSEAPSRGSWSLKETDPEFFKRAIVDGIQRSVEYASDIMYSKETGVPVRINGNVKNNGIITNLPQGCCVEVPCLIDRNGIHPCHVGDLPPQCAALNRTNINVQELAVKAAFEKDKTLALQAILLDPLTSATLSIDETRKMVDEMFKANSEYLKDYK